MSCLLQMVAELFVDMYCSAAEMRQGVPLTEIWAEMGFSSPRIFQSAGRDIKGKGVIFELNALLVLETDGVQSRVRVLETDGTMANLCL